MNNIGVYTTEDGWFFEKFFTVSGLIFIGILALLIWGLYSYLKNRKDEERSDQRFNDDIYSIRNDREYIQANLREREAEEIEENADTPLFNDHDK